jgi:hypothetical protein
MSPGDFDEIARVVKVSHIAFGRDRSALDWEHIRDLREQNRDFDALFKWISHCLQQGKAYEFSEYDKLVKSATAV